MQRYITFILGLILAIGIQAQKTLNLPNTCGFEQGEDLSDWTLNPSTHNAFDQWCIGSATASVGKQSLYISMDDGHNARFGPYPNTVCAYRKFRFPVSNVLERYDIAFDWRNFGDRRKGRLHVSYFPSSELNERLQKMSETSGLTYPDNEYLWSVYFEEVITGGDTSLVLYNSEGWKTSTLHTKSIPAVQSGEWVLMFVWVNQQTDSASAYRLGACIDNIQITNNRAKRPENVEAEINCMDSSMVISWESTMSEFILAYKSNVDEQWHRQEGITDRIATHDEGLKWSYRLPYMTEGVYQVKLWSINRDNVTRIDTSGCVTLQDVVNYCPDNHCIDYMHLDAANVTCTYGTYEDPYANIGIIDYGSMEKESRHTIVSDISALDERTNFKLKMVPTGAISSVRLGNWDNNAEAESITYEYVVDSTQGVLLLKYAIVLEDPQHNITHQPYFSLQVLDENGQLIDGACAEASYYAGHGAGEWTKEKYIEHTPTGAESHDILWKNWTTVGLNLSKHHGEKVRVVLTTKDCSEGMHYGYAYFVLDCTTARLSTNNCAMAAYSEATAPEGFNYEWRRVQNDSVVSHDRSIRVDAADPSPYSCTCTFTENEDCSFKLQTYFQPEYPVADYKVSKDISACKSYLKLMNASYIVYYEGGQEIKSADQPKDYLWEIETSSGQKWNPSVPNITVDCDPNGDTVYIAFHAYLSSKNCYDDKFDTIVMPNVYTPDSILEKDLCEGGWVEFDGKYYAKSGTYVHHHVNQYGCDSSLILNLRLHAKPEPTYLVDSICSSHPYKLGDMILTESGEYNYTFYNQYLCDSIVYLSLTAYQQPIPKVQYATRLCSDEKELMIDYALVGKALRIELNFDDNAHQGGWKDYQTTQVEENGTIHYPLNPSLRVGQWEPHMVFIAEGLCQDTVIPVSFTLNYTSTIMEQKWNDVVTLLSTKYNGGYTFSKVQWFRNGQMLEGQNGYYVYLPKDMQAGDEYYAELTNQYGTTVTTCPITVVPHQEQGEHPTIRKQLVQGRLQIQVNDNRYDAQGLLITTGH